MTHFAAPVTRRDFVKGASTLAGLSALGLSSRASADFAEYPMGLQLYTIRDPLAQDVFGTLKHVAAMGYRDLETYGFDPARVKYYGLDVKDFKRVLVDNGLTTSSGHYDLFLYLKKPLEEMMAYVDRCIEGALALDQAYITWPWLDPESRGIDAFHLLAERLNRIGEQVQKAGLQLAYHNHDFEFVEHDGGRGYDILIRDTDPALVKLQLDLFWVAHSSPWTALELFERQPGRFTMWHIKDMDRKSRKYTELGQGSIDFTKILPHAKLAGLEYFFIEQGDNFALDPMRSIADSATFFREHLARR